jgi:hypothetical protein
LVALNDDEVLMEHFNADWTEQSPGEKSRLPLLIIIVFAVMIGAGTAMIGVDGLLRMIGLRDDALKLTVSVNAEPPDTLLYLNNSPIENPSELTVSWLPGTKHIFDAQHPAFISERVTVHVPTELNKEPELSFDSQQIQTDIGIGRLDIFFLLRPEYITLPVESTPCDATIVIDGIETNRNTPFEYSFRAGETVTITASKDGYIESTEQFQIPSFPSDETIVMTLEKKPAAVQAHPTKTPAPTGIFRVSSDFPLDVYRGSRRIVHQKSRADVTLNTGRHDLRFINKEYLLNHEMTITISANRVYPVTLDSLGQIQLDSSPTAATIDVEGIELGKTPGTFSVYPGLYNVALIFEDCDDIQHIWVRVVSGQTRRIPPVRGCQ